MPITMKTRILLLSVLLVILVCSIAQAAPHLTIKESTFNFGYVPQNSKITHDFWLQNTGNDTLKIVKVVPG